MEFEYVARPGILQFLSMIWHLDELGFSCCEPRSLRRVWLVWYVDHVLSYSVNFSKLATPGLLYLEWATSHSYCG